MATITLKNVPRLVHFEIKKRAEKNNRSINNEIITCLETVLGLRADEVDLLLTKIEKVQKGLPFLVSNEEIPAAKIKERNK